jgi:hypothetical protein
MARRDGDIGKVERHSPYPRRAHRAPFEDEVPNKLGEVIEHWKTVAPITPDAAVAADAIAQNIVPANDRNCAAVFLRAAGVPLVAMNSWNKYLVEGGGEQNHAVIYAANAYEKVQYTDEQLHAEMKILQYCFSANYDAGNNYHYIGISKRCCLRCAVVMKIQGFTSRGCSGGLWDAGWSLPAFVFNSVDKLKAFMGDDTYAWYKDLKATQQKLFIGAMQNAKD